MALIYTHNGDSNQPHVFVVETGGGQTVAEFNVAPPGQIKNPQAIRLDWLTHVLYLADIGDPQGSRNDIALWGVPEPGSLGHGTLAGVRYGLTYPFPAVDAQALAIHPKTGEKYIITCEANGRLVKFPKTLGGSNLGQNLNKVMPANVTDATFTMDGKWLLIRAQDVKDTIVYNATTFAFDGNITSPSVAQGRSITAEPEGTHFLIGGGERFAPIFRVALPSKYAISSTPAPTPGEKDPTPGKVVTVNDSRVNESSGLAISFRHSKFVWTHNDEGQNPQIFGISLSDGGVDAAISLSGVPSRKDPEAIRVHPITHEIWFGDIGDNNNEDGDHPGDVSHRTDCCIIILPEPNKGSLTAAATDYQFSYPGGKKYNAESIIIHPTTGSAYIITKGNVGKLFGIPLNAAKTRPVSQSNTILEDKGKSLPSFISDADFSVDGKWVFIRRKNLSATYVLDGSDWSVEGNIPMPSGTSVSQCEGIAVEAEGKSFLLSSEGRPFPIVRVLIPAKWRPAGSSSGGGGTSECDTDDKPADVLNLTNYKITLPIGPKKDATEVKQPALKTYEHPQYFYVACPGPQVVFRAPANGSTTSGSSNPRSELREMKNGGSDEAAWNSGSGTHTMEATLAFTHLPDGKPHVVGLQIHDADDDLTVLRLEGKKLMVTYRNNDEFDIIDTNYQIGTYLKVKIVANSSGIKWYFDGTLKATVPGKYSGCYFKAGCYTQANPDNGGSGYGEVRFKALKITHS